MFARSLSGLQSIQLHSSNPSASTLRIRPLDSSYADLFACVPGGSYLLPIGDEGKLRIDDGRNADEPNAPAWEQGNYDGLNARTSGTFKTAASQNRRGQSHRKRVWL